MEEKDSPQRANTQGAPMLSSTPDFVGGMVQKEDAPVHMKDATMSSPKEECVAGTERCELEHLPTRRAQPW